MTSFLLGEIGVGLQEGHQLSALSSPRLRKGLTVGTSHLPIVYAILSPWASPPCAWGSDSNIIKLVRERCLLSSVALRRSFVFEESGDWGNLLSASNLQVKRRLASVTARGESLLLSSQAQGCATL